MASPSSTTLPKIKHPIFHDKLPSNKTDIAYRPYTVKEEKILLIAAESNDMAAILNSIKQVITNCVVTQGFNVEMCAQIDVEYLFLKLRAISNTNLIVLNYKKTQCPKTEGGICKDPAKVEVDINTVGVEHLNEKEDTFIPYDQVDYAYGENGRQFMLDDELGVQMRFPRLSDLKDIDTKLSSIEYAQKLTVRCIVAFFDKEIAYYAKDFTEQQLNDYYESLLAKQKQKITSFVKRIPQLRKTVKYQCDKCEFAEEVQLTGLKDFFG